MQWLTKKTITKTYIMAILVLGMTFSPLPQFTLATALLILNLYTIYKQLTPKINIALLLTTIILAPVTLTQLTGNILSSLFVLPLIYLLDQDLKEYAITESPQPQKRTRKLTPLLKTTLIALGTILATSLTIVNLAMISATVILIVYFTIILGIASLRIPKKPIQETKTWSRLLAGSTEKKTIPLMAITKQPLYLTVTAPQTWVRMKQLIYFLQANKNADIEVTYTPPLAGPTKIQLCASVLDTRGLIQITQLLEPIELHVIPRAKYAQWLAKNFLEHSGSGAASTTAISALKSLKSARRSIEYYGNRPYQPGDRLREVDWKHTFKLGELIVKEFAGSHKQPIIILANLDTSDAEKADRLAYNMVISAVTSAAEALPTGLALFNKKTVVAATPLTDPRETLKRTLDYTNLIAITSQPIRVLQLTGSQTSKSTIGRTGNTKIREVLEHQVHTKNLLTKTYSGSQAFNRCTKITPAPATIVIASSVADDEEALLTTLEKITEKGYKAIQLRAN